MRGTVAHQIANQIHEWGHRGLIGEDLQAVLTRRYAVDVTMGRVLLRWLGFFALALLAMSILGVLSIALGPVRPLAPFALGVLAYFIWTKGVQLATDPQQRYATSGAVLVTVSLVTALAALYMLPFTVASPGRVTAPWRTVVVAAAAIYTAYRYGLRWPLTLGLLLSFNALGTMHGYAGFGSYWLDTYYPMATSILAVVAIAVGVTHEEWKADEGSRHVGFGQIYIVLGLLFANVAVWWWSLIHTTIGLVLFATAVCIGQFIIGARRHDGRFTGFGIVFLTIHLYTRLFEQFWDELSKGAALLVAGGIAMAIGAVMESWARRLKGATA